MKVFQVITERTNDENKEVMQVSRYVTSFDNSFLTVSSCFSKYCEEFEEELIAIKEILTISQHIND